MITINYTKKTDANNQIRLFIRNFTLDMNDNGDHSFVLQLAKALISSGEMSDLLAPKVKFQFSTDATSWHDTFAQGDIYMRVSNDDGETYSSAMQFIQSMSGTFEDLIAGDIMPKSTDLIPALSPYAIQTTGGSEDLKSGAGEFRSIRGNLDENCNPFMADTFVSTGMNLVDPEETITINGKTAYIFPVKKGTWGEYGTTQENNGYVIITEGSVNGVYFKTTKPTASSYGSACGKTTYNGVDHYTTPSDGWLVIIMNDSVVPACHVTWSSQYDDTAGTFANVVKNILSAIQSVHSWGLSALNGANYSSFDEVDFVEGKGYPRNDRTLLPGLSWNMTTETSEGSETTTYVFTATVSAMKSNGLWRANYNGISVEGNTLTIRSTSITSVADLQTALAGIYFYYEKASYSAVTISNAATLLANTVNDMGLSYFLYNGELVSVPAYVTEAFYQGGKDRLFNNITHVELVESVIAHVLSELNLRIDGIGDKMRNSIVEYIMMSAKGKNRQLLNLTSLFKIQGHGSPITAGLVPDFIGEEYYDVDNKKKYEAFGVDSASDWVLMN